jgi:preprotein translocase subunit SecD
MDPPSSYGFESLFVARTSELTNDDLQSTGVESDDGQTWKVVLTLNEQAKARFGELSKKMALETTKRERLAVFIDGGLLLAPIVTAPMTDGVVPLSGPFSKDEAQRIAKGIVGH